MKKNIESLINDNSTNTDKLQESDSERKLCKVNIEQNWSISKTHLVSLKLNEKANSMSELANYKDDSHSDELTNLADTNSHRLRNSKYLKKTFYMFIYFLLITILVTYQLQITNLKNRLSDITSKYDTILNEFMLAKDATSKLQYVIKKVGWSFLLFKIKEFKFFNLTKWKRSVLQKMSSLLCEMKSQEESINAIVLRVLSKLRFLRTKFY